MPWSTRRPRNTKKGEQPKKPSKIAYEKKEKIIKEAKSKIKKSGVYKTLTSTFRYHSAILTISSKGGSI